MVSRESSATRPSNCWTTWRRRWRRLLRRTSPRRRRRSNLTRPYFAQQSHATNAAARDQLARLDEASLARLFHDNWLRFLDFDGRLRRSRLGPDGLLRHPLVPFSENHFARGGLQHRRDRDVDGLADRLARIVDYDHGSIVKIGDALVVFFAFLEDEDMHDFAGKDDRL